MLTGSLQELLEDPVTQHALVAAHAHAIQQLVKSCGLPDVDSTAWSSGMELAEPLATAVTNSLSRTASQVMESCGGYMHADINTTAAGGVIRQLISRISSLYPQNSPSAKGAIDVTSPCLQEKTRAVTAVSQLKLQINQLLDRFPGQPLLEQMLKICERILGMLACALRAVE